MRRVILVVCDSLRADMIQPDVAPTLAGLGISATRYAGARGVFPSVTRVTLGVHRHGLPPGEPRPAGQHHGDEPKDYTGFGQHGGLGPNEQRPFLFVWGGEFPEGVAVDAPVCHVDLAPTVLAHLGVPAHGMDGRPLPVTSAVPAE